MPASVGIQSIGHQLANDGGTATLRLIITDVSGGTIGDAYSALSTAGYTLGAAYTATAGITGATLTNIDLQVLEGSAAKTWQATVSYNNRGNDFEIIANYERKELTTRAELIDVWRIDGSTAMPAPANLNNPAQTDIAGQPIDNGGEPLTIVYPQQEITITRKLTGSQLDPSTVRTMVGKRNSATFEGAAAGYVLFVGSRQSRIGYDLYEVTYTFVWDGAAHCRQSPDRAEDGRPSKTGSGTYAGKAYPVYWKQPFPGTANFADLPGL